MVENGPPYEQSMHEFLTISGPKPLEPKNSILVGESNAQPLKELKPDFSESITAGNDSNALPPSTEVAANPQPDRIRPSRHYRYQIRRINEARAREERWLAKAAGTVVAGIGLFSIINFLYNKVSEPTPLQTTISDECKKGSQTLQVATRNEVPVYSTTQPTYIQDGIVRYLSVEEREYTTKFRIIGVGDITGICRPNPREGGTVNPSDLTPALPKPN